MFYSILFLFGISVDALAADPALELLRTYEADESHPELERMIEAVALDRLDARIALLPPATRKMAIADMVDRHIRWFYTGLPLGKALGHLQAITVGESAERSISQHVLLPVGTWNPSWTEDNAVTAGSGNWLGPQHPDRLLGDKHESTVLNTIHPSSGEHFKVVPSDVRIETEHGLTGNGNGNIDPGEWFKLSVAIAPTGTPIFFSTSATVTSSHPCVWATQVGEQVIPEFRLSRKAQPVSFWMYVSEDCKPGSRIELSMTVTETKLGTQIDQFPVSFTVHSGPGEIDIQTSFDYDAPGSSEIGTPAFQPGHSAEIAVDLMAPSASNVRIAQRHQLPSVVGGMTALDGEQPYPMERRGGVWAAGNDLDFSLEGEDIVGPWLEKMDRSWTRGSSPQVALGAEMVLSPRSKVPVDARSRLNIALSAIQEQVSESSDPAQQIAAHKSLVYLEKNAMAAYDRPNLASSQEMIRLVDGLVASNSNATPWVGQYRFRRVYMVPIDYEPVYIPPPPPPAPPPRRVAPPPPEPEEYKHTTFAFGIARFAPKIEQREFDDDKPDLDASSVLVRLIFGEELQFFIDGGGVSDGSRAAHVEGSFGMRYNVLFLPQIRLGPHAGAGIRYVSAVGVAESAFMGHAGASVDVYPVKNVGLWIQASAATPSPAFVGKDSYRIAVKSRRVLWGAEIAF